MPNATVGIWARLRTFMFLREEIFTPESTLGLKTGPKIVGAFSMRKNELQVDGYKAPRFTAATTEEFFKEQYHLLQYMWRMPSQELCREEAEREEFAIHLVFEEAQKAFALKADSSEDSFCLSHPDLRVNNIIVDNNLHICGVIDWEFSVTVPRHVFLPPLWISGLDTVSTVSNIDLLSEFMSVLGSMSQLSSSHSQLAQDWDFRGDLRLPIGYIFLDPSDLVLLFYRCIYPKLYSEPCDKVVPTFFRRPENKELQVGLERQLRTSEQYTQYLKDNNLFDDEEEAELQPLLEFLTKAQNDIQGIQEWYTEARDTIERLDGERAVQRGQEQQV